MDRPEDLATPPIVGRYYLVPCVEIRLAGFGWSRGFWPVIGPEHEDAKLLNFSQRHFHVDARFLTAPQLAEVSRFRHGVFSNPICTSSRIDGRRLPGWRAPTLRKRLCQREQPAYPARGLPELVPELPAAFVQAKVKCGRCPHKGLPLSSLPREPGTDIVTCPGHGLRWDLASGALMRKAVARGQ